MKTCLQQAQLKPNLQQLTQSLLCSACRQMFLQPRSWAPLFPKRHNSCIALLQSCRGGFLDLTFKSNLLHYLVPPLAFFIGKCNDSYFRQLSRRHLVRCSLSTALFRCIVGSALFFRIDLAIRVLFCSF